MVALALPFGMSWAPPSQAKPLQPEQILVAERALAEADRRHWASAALLANQAELPALAAYVEWLRLQDPDGGSSFAAYLRFVDQYGDWPALSLLQKRAEAVLEREMVANGAVRAFFANRRPLTRAGRLRLAQSLEQAGELARAQALRRESWVLDGFSAEEERQFLLSYGPSLDPAAHRERLDRLLWDGDGASARRMLQLVGPDWRALADARLLLRTESPGVDRAIRAVPPSMQDDSGLAYERVRWRRSKGLDAEARDVLLARRDGARAELMWGERSRFLRQALETREYAIAYRLAAGHGLRSGATFADAEWTAGWIALRFRNDPAAGIRHFQKFEAAVSTPISRARAGYWAGRAAAATGDAGQAQRWYLSAARFPTTYYGQLAADELGMAVQADAVVTAAAPQPPSVGSDSPGAVIRMLCRIGEFRRATPFVTKLAADTQGDLGPMLALVAECGRPDLLVRASKAASGGEATLHASHPLPQVSGFTDPRVAEADPALRLAVARQESLFDPDARSPVGARGMMQLMPATGRAVARELGLPFAPERLTADPEFNVRLGSHYLSRQLERFDRSMVMALAAYNAGPSRVLQWIETFGDPRGMDLYRLIDWVELIPLSETRNYVQRVLENRVVYRLRLEAPDATSLRAVPVESLREAVSEPADRDRS
jgi:soluble lytic murein transglycosylase